MLLKHADDIDENGTAPAWGLGASASPVTIQFETMSPSVKTELF